MLAVKIFKLGEDGVAQLLVKLGCLKAHCVEESVFAAVLDGFGRNRRHSRQDLKAATER